MKYWIRVDFEAFRKLGIPALTDMQSSIQKNMKAMTSTSVTFTVPIAEMTTKEPITPEAEEKLIALVKEKFQCTHVSIELKD